MELVHNEAALLQFVSLLHQLQKARLVVRRTAALLSM
jgi:hypothetical protein